MSMKELRGSGSLELLMIPDTRALIAHTVG